MNKNHLFSALIISSALFWQSCGSSDKSKGPNAAQQEQPAIAVTMGSVEQEIVEGSTSYPATVVPLQETEIRAEVGGYITKINVADGAVVSKGQVLYEIDRVRYQAAVNQAEANLAITKANLQRVQKDLERYQTLASKDAIAKQTLDYALTDVSNQKAQIQAAEANLLAARTDLQRSVIRAPFSGTIGISQVRTGALVGAGSTLLNTVSTTNPIAIEIQISEKDIKTFTDLQNGNVSTAITATLPDGTTTVANGRIVTIDRAIDTQTGTLKVRAAFDNASSMLRAGMNLTLQVASNSTEEQLVVPYKAIFEQLGTFNIYTVNDSSIAVVQQVELGSRAADRIVIKKGLQQGNKIIIDGIMNVRNGAKVTEAAAAAAAPAQK